MAASATAARASRRRSRRSTARSGRRLTGFDAADQRGLDQRLRDLDGTENKKRLGANAILGVSLAAAKAEARVARHAALSLYRRPSATLLPVPMMNIINGGAHADNPIDFQEFMIVPVGASSIAEAVRMGAEVFHALTSCAEGRRPQHQRSATRAASPPISPRPARRSTSSWRRSPPPATSPGEDVYLALDVAATELYAEDRYFLKGEKRSLTSEQMAAYYAELVASYPIFSIEDGMSEDDWEGWRVLTESAGRPRASSSATISSSPMSRG